MTKLRKPALTKRMMDDLRIMAAEAGGSAESLMHNDDKARGKAIKRACDWIARLTEWYEQRTEKGTP